MVIIPMSIMHIIIPKRFTIMARISFLSPGVLFVFLGLG